MTDTWTTGTIVAVTISAIILTIALIAATLVNCFHLYQSIRVYLIQQRLNRQ